MSFDISTLVTDRGAGTYYNASDLNRVGAAVQYVAERFAAQGYTDKTSPRCARCSRSCRPRRRLLTAWRG